MSDDVSEDTKDLVSKAMRGDQRVKAEDLVANELAVAVLSEPMPKIRHTCEALMLLGGDERDAANISEEEQEEAEKIYQLCQTLQNVFLDKFTDDYGEVIERSATIPWHFDQDEVDEWLDWIPYTSWRIYGSRENHQKSLEKGRELSREGRTKESLYVVTGDKVTVETYNRIKSQFIHYAMPKAAKLLKKIIQVVSSSSFQAAMDRLKGGASSGQGQG